MFEHVSDCNCRKQRRVLSATPFVSITIATRNVPGGGDNQIARSRDHFENSWAAASLTIARDDARESYVGAHTFDLGLVGARRKNCARVLDVAGRLIQVTGFRDHYLGHVVVFWKLEISLKLFYNRSIDFCLDCFAICISKGTLCCFILDFRQGSL